MRRLNQRVCAERCGTWRKVEPKNPRPKCADPVQCRGAHQSPSLPPRPAGPLSAAEWLGKTRGNVSGVVFGSRRRSPGEEGRQGTGAWGRVTQDKLWQQQVGPRLWWVTGALSWDRQALPTHLCGRLWMPKQMAYLGVVHANPFC